MRKNRYNLAQILPIINQYNTGRKVTEIAYEYKISPATFYVWYKKYSTDENVTLENQEIKRIKDLEEENGRLKQMYVELAIDNRGLKECLSKK